MSGIARIASSAVGKLSFFSASDRDLPNRQQPDAGEHRGSASGQGRRRHHDGAPSFVALVEHALDIDDVLLVARIEQQLAATARARQIDVDDLPNTARRLRHHDDLVGQEDGFVDRMGDKQHCLAVTLPDVQEIVLEARPGVSVKRAEWLVHQQDFGMISERPGQCHALLHAARQLASG